MPFRAKVRHCVRALLREGWTLVNVRGGSHAKFVKNGRHVVIPHYNRQNQDIYLNSPEQQFIRDLL